MCFLANAHRVFVTQESGPASPILTPSFLGPHGNLTGIVSIVDSKSGKGFRSRLKQLSKPSSLLIPVLSLFARSAKIENVDPTQMQRHRRASSASQSPISDRDTLNLSRSNSRASIQRSPNVIASSPASIPLLDSGRNSVPVFSLDPLSTHSKRRSVNVKRDVTG